MKAESINLESMETQMAKLRHLAMLVEDIEKTASFCEHARDSWRVPVEAA